MQVKSQPLLKNTIQHSRW